MGFAVGNWSDLNYYFSFFVCVCLGYWVSLCNYMLGFIPAKKKVSLLILCSALSK